MTTTTYDPGSRPLHQVLSPDDYADVRRRLQRGRWWRFLNARDRLLALARRVGRTVSDLTARAVGRFRLDGTAPAVGRTVRWAAGRAGLAAAALRAAGPVPTLTWAASTRWGQTVLGAAARTAATAVAAVGRSGAGVLARLGAPGQRVLAGLRATRRRLREGLASVAAQPATTATLANWRLVLDLLHLGPRAGPGRPAGPLPATQVLPARPAHPRGSARARPAATQRPGPGPPAPAPAAEPHDPRS